MPVKPNKSLDILNRRQQVAQLYLQNWNQSQIAEHLGVRQPTVTETALDIQQQFRPDFFGVETNQFQELLADDMVRRSHERGIYLPLFTVENTVPKVVRIRRLTPLLSQRRLRFKAGSKGAKLLVEQLRDFPCGEHDDAPDALEVALRLASEQLRQIADEEYYRQQPFIFPIEYRCS
jgi:predicted phage terminase large subunit-like protein